MPSSVLLFLHASFFLQCLPVSFSGGGGRGCEPWWTVILPLSWLASYSVGCSLAWEWGGGLFGPCPWSLAGFMGWHGKLRCSSGAAGLVVLWWPFALLVVGEGGAPKL